MPSAAEYPQIRRKLLAWYRRHKRDLPWRRTRDPYAIWISEIMLQQTRVEAVIPYFERFLGRFPGIAALARAPQDDVLAAWSGLGYYRRARHLHAAAKEMFASYEGKFPQGQEEIRALPGIGPYTAGAILSIAFEKRAPILDGNVIRLLTRLFAIPGDPNQSDVRRKLWTLAEEILPREGVRDFNQALMELPALVCTPRSPRCGECPLATFCIARKKGQAERFPQKAPKAPAKSVSLAFACTRRQGKFLLQRRQESPMEGMWEFPAFGSQFGIEVSGWIPLGETKHSIMDRRITARYFLGEFREGECKGGRWFSIGEIGRNPVTTLTKKGLALYRSKKTSTVLPALTVAVLD